MDRIALIIRTTTETEISVTLEFRRFGVAAGIGFLDHMLTALTRHGLSARGTTSALSGGGHSG